MSFSKRLAVARKDKELSQGELADMVESTSITIGRYERDKVMPPLEAAAKIAAALGVSLDYLAGLTDSHVNAATLNKVLEIQNLPEADSRLIMTTLDALLRDAKARKAYA